MIRRPPISTLFLYTTLFRSRRSAKLRVIASGEAVAAALTGMPAVHRVGPGRSEEHSLNSSHLGISYAVFCLKKKKEKTYYKHVAQTRVRIVQNPNCCQHTPQ